MKTRLSLVGPRCRVVTGILLQLAWAGLPAAAQIITDFSPAAGSVGTQVMITGTQFFPGTLRVEFNGVVDPTAQATSPTIIFANVPAGATTGPITVRVGNKSTTSIFDFMVIGAGPVITGFLPRFGAVNDPIQIFGFNLVNPNQTSPNVHFGGVQSRDVIVNSAGTIITARVPAGATNAPIRVTTSLGSSNSLQVFQVIGPGPFLGDFQPRVGTPGDIIALEGVHFSEVTSVLFGSLPAAFFIQSDLRIDAQVPNGATNGPIRLLSRFGTNSAPLVFFVPPVVSSFTPLTGRAGTNVSIRGINFSGALGVTIGGVEADFVVPSNNTNIVATVPAGGVSGPVRVITPAGSALSVTNFRYQPTLTSFTPAAGGPGIPVTLNGANLNEGLTNVSFAGVTARVTNVTASRVVALVPEPALSGPITASTTNGTVASSANFYAPPAITNISPAQGGAGTQITLRGLNFLDASAVFLGGVPAGLLGPATNNFELRVTVTPGALTGPVTITTPGGVTNSSDLFYAPPLITSFTPEGGLPGTNVTVSGVNFTGATSVLFGNVPATEFTVVSNTLITAKVPAGAQTGLIGVVAPGGTNRSTQNFVVAYISDLGVRATADPVPALPGSPLKYSLVVTNGGPFAATDAVVTIGLPPQAALKGVAVSQGSVATNGTALTWSPGPLAARSAALATITVAPPTTGTLVFSATVNSGNEDPHPADNTLALSTPVLDAPRLSITPLPSRTVQVSWPAAFTNFSLQFRDQVNAGNWTAVPGAPVLTNGQRAVVDSATAASRFYRLAD